MDQQLQSYIGQIQIGEEQNYKNLTTYPVLLKRLGDGSAFGFASMCGLCPGLRRNSTFVGVCQEYKFR